MVLNQITIEDILERYSVLPDELLVILEDPNTEKIVETVCQKNNVSKPEWIDTIKQLVGYVLMGFIHYYDLGAEINTELNFPNPKLGKDIASEIETKVFASIKDILEKNYSPLVPKKEEVFVVPTPEVLKEEIKKTQTTPQPEPVLQEKTILEKQKPQETPQKQPEIPKPVFITETVKLQEQKTPPQPQTIPIQKEAHPEQKIPTVLISEINIPPKVQAPIPPIPPQLTKTPPPPQPIPQTPKTTPIPTPIPTPKKPEITPTPPRPETISVPTPPTPTPPPVFLHKEEIISPIKKGVEIKPPEIKISSINPPPPPPKPVQIEIGKKESQPSPKIPQVKIKNYYETDIKEVDTKNQTLPPKPPQPPTPPPPPPK